MSRRQRIELLLATRFVYTLEPETFTGKVVRRAAAQGKASPRQGNASRVQPPNPVPERKTDDGAT